MKHLRWLQYGTIDFESGPGGAEMHVRCVAEQLRRRGHDVVLSHDPAILAQPWDVVQTHGSVIPQRALPLPRGAVRIHTLHGSTWLRMRACHEWLWAGGYRAIARERLAFEQADGILSIHDQLPHYQKALRVSKPHRICSNGWDAGAVFPSDSKLDLDRASSSDRITALLERARGRPLWLFIGRGNDIVKGADVIQKVVASHAPLAEFFWVSVPGDGFPLEGPWAHSGALSPAEIQRLLEVASGLVIPSRYEGLPLVALEALAHGTPVVAHAVGGLTTLASELQGFAQIPFGEGSAWIRAIERAPDSSDRKARSANNRRYLKTWADVATQAESLALELRRAL